MSDKPTFTPPPYSIDWDEVEPGESITICAVDGSVQIATVNNYYDFPCLDNEDAEAVHTEAVATARLFAASPDLYSAITPFTDLQMANLGNENANRARDEFLRHCPEYVGYIKQAILAVNKATTGGQAR